MDAAIELYRLARFKSCSSSGDNTAITYNEPGQCNICIGPRYTDEDQVLYYAGRRTYDSCTVPHTFLVGRMIVVTQAYHLPRSLFL
jgi:vancomycin permeability regulator SanA